jgi:BMFP domain-containing protein YqiC
MCVETSRQLNRQVVTITPSNRDQLYVISLLNFTDELASLQRHRAQQWHFPAQDLPHQVHEQVAVALHFADLVNDEQIDVNRAFQLRTQSVFERWQLHAVLADTESRLGSNSGQRCGVTGQSDRLETDTLTSLPQRSRVKAS